VLVPVLMLAVLLIVEAALVRHGNQVAKAAAEDGAAAARAYGGSVAAGEAEARDTLAQLGSGLLDDVAVNVQRDPSRARVEVTGRVRGVLPGIRPTVRAVSSGMTERFVAEGRQGP
jgi:TadE-like protein.